MYHTIARTDLLPQNPPGLHEGLRFVLLAKLRPYYESFGVYLYWLSVKDTWLK